MIRTATQLKAKIRNLSGGEKWPGANADPELRHGAFSGKSLAFIVSEQFHPQRWDARRSHRGPGNKSYDGYRHHGKITYPYDVKRPAGCGRCHSD